MRVKMAKYMCKMLQNHFLVKVNITQMLLKCSR